MITKSQQISHVKLILPSFCPNRAIREKCQGCDSSGPARHGIVIEKIRKVWLDAKTLSDRLGIQNEVDGPQVTRGVGSTERK